MKRIAAYVGLAHSVERVYSKDTLQTLAERYDFIADGRTLTTVAKIEYYDINSRQSAPIDNPPAGFRPTHIAIDLGDRIS